MDLDHRQAVKDRQLRPLESAEAEDILAAVMDIYQMERGIMIEDEEAYSSLQEMAADLLTMHDADAGDAGDLVDRILADIPGSFTYRDPTVSGHLLS